MIDVHCHVLPCVDDGARSVEESVELLKMQYEQGIKKVIFTPHFSAEKISVEKFCKRRNDSFNQLNDYIASQPDVALPERYLGAEVMLTQNLSKTDGIEKLCLPDGKHILIELPTFTWGEWVYSELFNIRAMKMITPVIAHIDRYFADQNEESIKRIVDLDMPIQFNIDCFEDRHWTKKFLRIFKRKPKNFMFIASDCHSVKHRPPQFDPLYPVAQKKLGKKHMEYINGCSAELLG